MFTNVNEIHEADNTESNETFKSRSMNTFLFTEFPKRELKIDKKKIKNILLS